MGNRAVVVLLQEDEDFDIDEAVGVYLHDNGGRDRVEAFLTFCDRIGARVNDKTYGTAQFVKVVSNFIGTTLGIGVGLIKDLDPEGENGLYIVKNWKIVGRMYAPEREEETHSQFKWLKDIYKAQPKSIQNLYGRPPQGDERTVETLSPLAAGLAALHS